MDRKTLTLVLLMAALGLVGYILLGWLVESRQGRSIQADTALLDAPGMTPLAALKTGAWLSTKSARSALSAGQRGEAAYALGSATRALQVAAHAAVARQEFQQALKMNERARAALQRGRPQQAGEYIERTIAVLVDIDAATAPDRQPAAFAGYEGAVLLNAMGVRIGEISGMRADAEGQLWALVVIGGVRDLLGFLDFGGSRIQVPASRLAFGKEQTSGPVMVAAATFATDLSDVRDELGDPSVLTAAL